MLKRLIALRKGCIAISFLLASALLTCSALHAQSLTTLTTFTTAANPLIGPPELLVQGIDGNLYGTVPTAPSGTGSLLKVTRTGSMSVVALSPVSDCGAEVQVADGSFFGRSASLLTVCHILPDGTSSAVPAFQDFLTSAGITAPDVVLEKIIQASDGFLYGTAYGPSNNDDIEGVVSIIWKMSLSGDATVFATLPNGQGGSLDGLFLQGKDGNFYLISVATTQATVFKVAGSGVVTTLYSFNGEPFPSALVYATDGALYGVTQIGGTSNDGIFFKIDTSGTFSVLSNLTSQITSSVLAQSLVQGSDGNFYGVQFNGGANGDGTICSITTAGVFSIAASFGSGNISPRTLINGSDGNIYGVTENPKTATVVGTIFKFVPGSSSGGFTPSISSGGIISASGFGAFSSIAPGTFIEIYGSNLAGDTRGWTGSDFNGVNAPTSLDGTSVSIGGQAAFVNYISPGQVNVLVPSNVPAGPQPLTVTTATGTSTASIVNVNSVEPGLLAPSNFNIGGNQYAVALFADGSYVLPTGAIAGLNSRPAKPGDIIVLYGIGLGPVTPNIPAGQLVGEINTLADSFTISVGGTSATVDYDGLAPSFTGLYQFNIGVPNVAAGNAVPLTFSVNGVPGTQTLYLAIGN
jgi:uncharacterized protein (TIGR03437 family)